MCLEVVFTQQAIVFFYYIIGTVGHWALLEFVG